METSHTIKIPSKLSMASVDEIYLATIHLHGFYTLIFDFSNVTFVTPEGLILLITTSRSFSDRFGHTIEWRNIPTEVLSYMDRMNINDFDFINIIRPSIFKRINYKPSTALVEASTIKDAQQLGQAIIQTREVLNRWVPESKKDCRQHLSTLIKETVENSIEHSSQEPSNGFCYYILQKYRYSDGSTEIQIAVGDTGIGMLASQRRVYPDTKDDAEAVIAALIKGQSGREDGCGGMGYVNIREALAPLSGRIDIRSGRAHIQHFAGRSYAKIYRHTYSCPGTQIIFHCHT